jgi:alpha 1,3-mannosyltransferase
MAFRLNTNRVSHTVRKGLHLLGTRVPAQRLKSLVMVLALTIVGYQLLLLASPSRVPLTYPGQASQGAIVLVVDKETSASTHYKHILEKMGESFPSKPLQEKCDFYFDELYRLNEDWEVMDTSKDANKDYKKEAFNHDQFIKDKVKDYKEEHNEEPSDGKKAEFEQQYNKLTELTLKTEQRMIDAVTHLRVYGQCYLRDHGSRVISNFLGGSQKATDSISDGSFDLCYDVEQRLFPWLSRELPTFKRWDGSIIKGIPKMSKYVSEYDDEDIPFTPKNVFDDTEGVGLSRLGKRSSRNECFMNQWRSSLNGKGIVLSVADKYEHDITGLLRVLRALNNKLPIQLVHKGDLSEQVQERIVKVARSEEAEVPLFSYDRVQNDVPHNFPKQEVWFVNAKRCIRKEYNGNFNGYANKLIAYLFNSFDDTILMDTDSVPLVKPSYFFKMGPYQRTKTIFFKDRFNAEKVSKHDSQFFVKLMPNSIDTAMFEIPKATNFTLEHNRYIKGQYRHLMEAGVVGIKRSTHFIGILTSVQMNFWSATNSRIWGDKELFWLGQSISGNENYEFNKYDVVAVGELTPMEDRPRNTIAHELCSTHPGHLSGDDDYTLLWINSGMRFCKVDDSWDGDMDQPRNKKYFKDSGELQAFYKQPVKISAALIPPGGDRVVENNNDEPAKGWVMTPSCKGYLWCAYDIVGGSTDPLDRGTFVEYDNVTEYINGYLGKLWLNQELVQVSKYDVELEKAIAKKKQTEKEEKAKAKLANEEKAKSEKLEKMDRVEEQLINDADSGNEIT